MNNGSGTQINLDVAMAAMKDSKLKSQLEALLAKVGAKDADGPN
jgi:hypothetical protein